MSDKVTREEMLKYLDDRFDPYDLQEEQDAHYAIRALIEKVGEWPASAKDLLDYYFTWDLPWPMVQFLQHIRDFGKEG